MINAIAALAADDPFEDIICWNGDLILYDSDAFHALFARLEAGE